ncbi:DNA-dependent metalloprotease SPRTN isoform X2 [Drosophila takahashii]|uniref:DNA-dependent metalloprotease SPRTN isoform X2 n=1 Tax=Drosophila takahashii TaxID=29030 RepID=UPI0038992894
MAEGDDYLFALMLHAQLNEEEEPRNSPPSGENTNKESDHQLALKIQALLNASDDEEAAAQQAAPGDLDSSFQFVYPSNKSQNHSKSQSTMSNNKKTTSKNRGGAGKEPPYALQSTYDDYLNQTQNLVHPQWELVDPTPDIFAMFLRFDDKFFQKRLGAVALEWSKKMYSCAGICYQRGNRYVKEVTIRLSEPLLKLRPRKDLVETLLHEMIHAYCFVLNIREGNGGHGPMFKRIMETINKVAGTNITVYHSFHDEVNAYKTHIWRCTGICQNRTPFQGYVKRTSNRAPGPNDQWWAKHQRECGGTFMKLGEPAKPPKPAKKEKKLPAEASSMRNWLDRPPAAKKPDNLEGKGPPAKKPATGEALLDNMEGRGPPAWFMERIKGSSKSRGANIMSFGDLSKSGEAGRGSSSSSQMSGAGYSVGGASEVIDITGDESPDPSQLRKIRLERFEGGKSTNQKRRRGSEDEGITTWESYDEDVMVRDVPTPMINLLNSDDSDEEQEKPKIRARNTMSSQERTQSIKREVMEDEAIYSEDEILMIDDEYDENDDSLTAATELADQSILDDLFGQDTLLEEFQLENSVQPSGSRGYSSNVDNDIVSCPICFEKMKRTELGNHFEGCTITVRVEPPSFNKKKPEESKASRKSSSSSKQTLRNCGYTENEIAKLNLSSSSSEDELTPRQRRQRNLFKQTVGCPKCGQELMGHQLEAHRSICKKRR